MSRTLSRPSHYFPYAFSAYIFVALVAIFTLFVPSAHADPHAVFYTDRAQEQLFYNTLAALNQADFVEPPTIQSGQYSRESLVDARLKALPSPLPGQSPLPFLTEDNPTLNATRTLLPGVVTRNITLEGNDLWTAYLFQQYALETDVRTSLSKLSRIFCTDALGQTGCNDQPGPSQNQATAFPTDTKAYRGEENLSFVSSLLSGTKTLKDFANFLTGTKPVDPNTPDPNAKEPKIPENLKVPLSNSAEIATLREDTKDKAEANRVVNQTANSIIASQYNTGLDPDIFSKFSLSNKGEVTYPEETTFDDHVDILRGVTSILPASIEIAERGREEAAAFKHLREQTPALAKYTLTKEPGGGVKGTITHPSTGIEAQINAGAQQLANQTINQNISSNTEITNPGIVPLLPIELPFTPSAPGQGVAGISTENAPQGGPGEVAGITDFALNIAKLYNTWYSEPRPNSNSPTTGHVPSFEEGGSAKFLEAIGGTNPNPNPAEKKCGFCVDLDKIINLGSVTQTINEVYSDMYCFFFPRTAACVARQTRL